MNTEKGFHGQGLRRGVLAGGGFNCDHLEGTLLQAPKGGTTDANRCGVGLRAGGFGPRPLASKQARDSLGREAGRSV